MLIMLLNVTIKLLCNYLLSPPEGIEKDKMEKTRTDPEQFRYLCHMS